MRLPGYNVTYRPVDVWPGEPVKPWADRPFSPFSATLTQTAAVLRRELDKLDTDPNVALLLPVTEADITVAGDRLKANARPEHPEEVTPMTDRKRDTMSDEMNTVEWDDLSEAQKRQVIDERLMRGVGTDRATGDTIPAPPDPESETP